MLAMGAEVLLYREYLEEGGQSQNSLITTRRKPNKEWSEVTRKDQGGTLQSSQGGRISERAYSTILNAEERSRKEMNRVPWTWQLADD